MRAAAPDHQVGAHHFPDPAVGGVYRRRLPPGHLRQAWPRLPGVPDGCPQQYHPDRRRRICPRAIAPPPARRSRPGQEGRRRLRKAERPVIFAGTTVWWDDAAASLRALAESSASPRLPQRQRPRQPATRSSALLFVCPPYRAHQRRSHPARRHQARLPPGLWRATADSGHRQVIWLDMAAKISASTAARTSASPEMSAR